MSEEHGMNEFEVIEICFPQTGQILIEKHVETELLIIRKALKYVETLPFVVPLLLSYDAKHEVVLWMKKCEKSAPILKEIMPALLQSQLYYEDHLLLLELALESGVSLSLAFESIVAEISKTQEGTEQLKDPTQMYEDAEEALHELETYYLSLTEYMKKYLELSPPLNLAEGLLLEVANEPSVPEDIQRLVLQHPGYPKYKCV